MSIVVTATIAVDDPVAANQLPKVLINLVQNTGKTATSKELLPDNTVLSTVCGMASGVNDAGEVVTMAGNSMTASMECVLHAAPHGEFFFIVPALNIPGLCGTFSLTLLTEKPVTAEVGARSDAGTEKWNSLRAGKGGGGGSSAPPASRSNVSEFEQPRQYNVGFGGMKVTK
jgi:hypothetical protein